MSDRFASRREPVPGYRLIERLGRGGFGEVWKVEAPGGFAKAMKLVFGDLGEDDPAARQELRALNRIIEIRHPFILTVERYDIVDGELVITMELADRNLEDRFKECRAQGLVGIPREELIRYMAEAAEALDIMNFDYSLQHLDIKPTNIFLVRKHVKVGDFGLVKEIAGDRLAISGGLTPLYSPPESYEGVVTRFTDQYALALVYQEMLTGVRAIDGANARELMYRTVVEGPNLLPLSKQEQPIVARAMHRVPEKRFPSCMAFVDSLRNIVQQTSVQAKSKSPRSPTAQVLLEPDEVVDDEGLLRPLSHQAAGRKAVAGDASVHSPAKEESEQRSCTLTGQLHRANVRIVRASIPTAIDAEFGSLKPTLVVGVGRTGIRAAERCWQKLAQRFGDAAAKLPVQFLHIDSDAGVLQDLAKTETIGEAAYPRFLACRLRRPSDYKSNWDAQKHINRWLSQEQLLKIGPTGETRGYRTLGRLALVDNYSRIAGRLIFELDRLTSAEFASEAAESTGLAYRSNVVRVVVLGGMAGGTGSGMVLDLAFMVKSVLLAAGIEHPEIILGLASNAGDKEDDPQSRVNQFAMASDLVTYWNPQQEFRLPEPIPGAPECVAGPPASAVLLFDPHAEHIPEPVDEVAFDALAEFLVHSSTSPWGKVLDERLYSSEPFVGVGWFGLTTPTDQVLRATASNLCASMIGRWLEPCNENEASDIRGQVRAFLETLPLAPAAVSPLMDRTVQAFRNVPFHHSAAEIINEVMDRRRQLTDRAEITSTVRAVRTRLRFLLGSDPVDDAETYSQEPEYDQVYRRGVDAAAGEIFEHIRLKLESIVDSVDRRFDVLRNWWLYFSSDVGSMYEKFIALPKTLELERAAYEAAYQLHAKLVRGATLVEYVASVEAWVKAKLEYRHRLQVAAVYLSLKGKIQSFAEALSAAPRKLEAVVENQRQDAVNAIGHGLGFVQQPLFAGGVASIEDAAEEVKNQLGDQRLDRMELEIRNRLMLPAGGIWKLCSDPEIPALLLAEEMSAASARWIASQIPNVDAARGFLDRHQSAETLEQEVQSLYSWSAPAACGRPPTSRAADQSEITTDLLLALPNSDDGRSLFESICHSTEVSSATAHYHPESDVSFVRFHSHVSLGRMLPMRVLRGRAAYENAKEAGSALIFTDGGLVTK